MFTNQDYLFFCLPLHYRAPRPVENWTGVFNATSKPNACMQLPDENFGRFPGVEMWNNNTRTSEDCLYLNLYVPKTAQANLPTLVWIYGGSFVSGSSSLDVYDGRFLASTQSVIVASLQYRLGVQGFLYMGTDDAPGNMGLLDQQLAIKWIHDNIHVFGGDRTKITLFGESAGSSSVSYHLIAPTTWPYFSRAIMLSASSLASWAYTEPSNTISKAQVLANVTNCSHSETSEIIKCLKNLDSFDLESKQWELDNSNIGTFLPTKDGYFLLDDPHTIMRSGNIKDADIMLGNTGDEGEFFLVYFYQDAFLPENLKNPDPLTRSQFDNVSSRIADYKSDLEQDALTYVYELTAVPKYRTSFRDMLDDICKYMCFIFNTKPPRVYCIYSR